MHQDNLNIVMVWSKNKQLLIGLTWHTQIFDSYSINCQNTKHRNYSLNTPYSKLSKNVCWKRNPKYVANSKTGA